MRTIGKGTHTENQNRFLFIGNASYHNRGCEAILLGTVKALERTFGNSQFLNYYFYAGRSPDPRREREGKNLRQIPIIIPPRWSKGWVLRNVFLRTFPSAYWKYLFKKMDGLLKESKAVLAIGGDNYGLDYSYPENYLRVNRYVHRSRRPFFLWGASVGPFKGHLMEKQVIRNFNDCVDAVFVREKRSGEYLKKTGYGGPVHVMGDPGFLMDPLPCGRQRLGFAMPRNAIGVNLSPLVGRGFSARKGRPFPELCVEVVLKLAESLKSPILLVPHSTAPWDDDYALLKFVYEKLKGKYPRLYLIPPDLTGPETKWVISKLGCLVAARTHATIAAFSSYVPTVSIAYSVKAWGINEMVFGHTKYVIDSGEISPGKITAMVEKVVRERSAIKKRLGKTVPEIKASVYEAAKELKKILGKDPRNIPVILGGRAL